jgi:D-sedoheptulose 7-phosphate isomerase
MLDRINDYIGREAVAICQVDSNAICQAVAVLSEVRKAGGRVYLAGNGGSAATASHFANDLRKVCRIDATALHDSIATLLAYGNDEGWINMFSKAMDFFKKDDVLIAISYSGASGNIIAAVEKVAELKRKTIVLTGPDSEINELFYFGCPAIRVDVKDIKIVEDLHLMICHAIVEALSNDLSGLAK